MKKNIYFLTIIIGLSLFSTSCSHKVAKASYPEYTSAGNTGTRIVEKIKEDIDECEQQANTEPTNEYRAYASAIDEDRDFARQQAVLFAKGQLVDRLQSQVINVMKGYRNKAQVNGKTANEGKIEQDVASMAERVIENCRIVCSNRYRLSDGTYECSVCISIPATDAELIAGAAALNDDDRHGLEFREQQFRDSYREELERFRNLQKERR